MSLFYNAFHLLSSLFATVLSVAGDKPMYNEEFFQQFKTPKEMQEFRDKVDELRNSGHTGKQTINISGRDIKIVIR